MKKLLHLIIVFFLLTGINMKAQTEKSVEGNVDHLPVREYTLTLKKEKVNKAGKEVAGMTINGTIPGPILEFNEGEYAVIYVKNEMDVETSIHWHGLLLPNFYDGVPYLNTPPIEPGHTLKYEFTIKQSGTYWYHGHTMLQEQIGVFGPIVIHPKKETLQYDKELVLMLSDWTNEKPMHVLRNLKRGSEWYSYRKGTSTPLNQVIKRGAFAAQLKFWKQRMEGADIADIILVNSNPQDIAKLILFGKATYKKMMQNLAWATGYNVIAIPLAAGVLYSQGIVLGPAVGAVLMSLSTVIVAVNAQLLKREIGKKQN